MARIGVSAQVLQALRDGQNAATCSLSETTMMRIAASRRFAFDEELESIEKELRRDLFWRGARLSSDSKRLQSHHRHQLPHGNLGQQLVSPAADTGAPLEKLVPPSTGDVPRTPIAGMAIATADAALFAALKSSTDEDPDVFGPEVAGGDILPADQTWNILSEEPWVLGGEPCTLIVMENDAQALIRFNVTKHATGETLQAICTQSEFQQLCEEQTGLSGSAQVKAAISQLFHGSQTSKELSRVAQDTLP